MVGYENPEIIMRAVITGKPDGLCFDRKRMLEGRKKNFVVAVLKELLSKNRGKCQLNQIDTITVLYSLQCLFWPWKIICGHARQNNWYVY